MTIDLLKQILAVPSRSTQEEQMVAFLAGGVKDGGVERRGRCWSDKYNNVYILKGSAEHYPCVAAHIDTVQPMNSVNIVEQDGLLVGFDEHGRRTGIGADDKAGVYICLELLERFNNIAVVLPQPVVRLLQLARSRRVRAVGRRGEFTRNGHGTSRGAGCPATVKGLAVVAPRDA